MEREMSNATFHAGIVVRPVQTVKGDFLRKIRLTMSRRRSSMNGSLSMFWRALMSSARRFASSGLGFLVLVSLCQSAAAATPTIKEVATELRSWRENLVNLRVVWHTWQMANIKSGYLELPDVSDDELRTLYYIRSELLWTDSASYRAADTWIENGQTKSREVRGSDGTLRWNASYTGLGHRLTHIRSQSSPAAVVQDPGLFAPLYQIWFGDGQWLDERLLERGATVTGEEELADGTRCVRVELPAAENLAPRKTVLLLDPDHRYLPRRVIPDRGDGYHPPTWVCDRFTRRPDGEPFPGEGHLNYRDDEAEKFDWKVIEVAANENIPAATFRPPRPESGTVVNGVLIGDPSGVTQTLAARAKASIEQQRATASPYGRWAAYSPSLIIAVMGVTLLAVGLYLRLRER